MIWPSGNTDSVAEILDAGTFPNSPFLPFIQFRMTGAHPSWTSEVNYETRLMSQDASNQLIWAWKQKLKPQQSVVTSQTKRYIVTGVIHL